MFYIFWKLWPKNKFKYKYSLWWSTRKTQHMLYFLIAGGSMISKITFTNMGGFWWLSVVFGWFLVGFVWCWIKLIDSIDVDCFWLTLIDADWCFLMLIHADWRWLILIYDDLRWLVLIDSDWFWLMLNYADWFNWCWLILIVSDWFWEMIDSDAIQSAPTSLGGLIFPVFRYFSKGFSWNLHHLHNLQII